MRRFPTRSAALRLAAGVALAALAGSFAGEPRPAWAAPLDAESCGRLKSDLAALEASGVRGDMARGPAEAKAKLPPARLQQIARVIDIEGQLRFRCPLEKPFVVLKEPPVEDAEVVPKTPVPKKKTVAKKIDGAAAKAPAGQPAKDPAKVQAKVPAKAGGESAGGAAAATKKAAAPAEQPPRPRPKAKADDAFRPAPAKKSDQ